jgi:hypothetical protein
LAAVLALAGCAAANDAAKFHTDWMAQHDCRTGETIPPRPGH